MPLEPDVPELPEEPLVPLEPLEPELPDEPDEPLVPLEPDEPLLPEVPEEPLGPATLKLIKHKSLFVKLASNITLFIVIVHQPVLSTVALNSYV